MPNGLPKQQSANTFTSISRLISRNVCYVMVSNRVQNCEWHHGG